MSALHNGARVSLFFQGDVASCAAVCFCFSMDDLAIYSKSLRIDMLTTHVSLCICPQHVMQQHHPSACNKSIFSISCENNSELFFRPGCPCSARTTHQRNQELSRHTQTIGGCKKKQKTHKQNHKPCARPAGPVSATSAKIQV